ncbi:MAG: TatD family hydrolase [Limisphaerales bacterium]
MEGPPAGLASLMAEFYDTHTHLDYPDFADDLPGLIERARAAGITRMVSIGTDLESSARAVALAERFESVFAVAGWHPNDAVRAPKDFRTELRTFAKHPKVIAIGETGLDYYRLPGANGGREDEDAHVKARQAEAFQQQLEVAAEVGLNCVIHTRGECFEETLRIIEPFASRVRGVFHCFVGTPEQMRRVLAMNSLVSFTGIVSFKSAAEVRATVAATPLERLMLETDAPFLAPVPYRGKRCESAYVREIAATVAQVKGVALEELSAATCRTAREFFPKLR